MTSIFSVLMKTDMHTYSSVNGTIPVLRLISSCTVRNVSRQHSYQFRAMCMNRKSVKSELQRDRSKESHWEGTETKSNHSTEFKKLVDNTVKHMVWFLGSSCGEPGAGLDDPYKSFLTQDILRFHEPIPWGRRPDHVSGGLALPTAALQ